MLTEIGNTCLVFSRGTCPKLIGLSEIKELAQTIGRIISKEISNWLVYEAASIRHICWQRSKNGSMIISLLMNITMNQLGGASVIAIFTTRRSHGYVNTTTWLGISQFFLFLAPNFNILTTENRSRCNRDLN